MSGVARSTYKLFVGNLPWTVGNKELQMYFSKFGHVSSAAVVYDKQQGFSKSYGFVTFSHKEAFNNACNEGGHLLEGRLLNVQQANS